MEGRGNQRKHDSGRLGKRPHPVRLHQGGHRCEGCTGQRILFAQIQLNSKQLRGRVAEFLRVVTIIVCKSVRSKAKAICKRFSHRSCKRSSRKNVNCNHQLGPCDARTNIIIHTVPFQKFRKRLLWAALLVLFGAHCVSDQFLQVVPRNAHAKGLSTDAGSTDKDGAGGGYMTAGGSDDTKRASEVSNALKLG